MNLHPVAQGFEDVTMCGEREDSLNATLTLISPTLPPVPYRHRHPRPHSHSHPSPAPSITPREIDIIR